MEIENQEQVVEDSGSAPVDAAPVTEEVDVDGGQQRTQEETEQLAKRMGWKDNSEFSGSKDFVSAEDFVRKGEEELPLLKKGYRRQDRMIAELQQSVKDMHSMMTKAEKVGYDNAMSEIEAKKRAAVEEGDLEQYDAINAEQRRVEDIRIKEQAQVNAQQMQAPPEIAEWEVDNRSWYNKDMELSKMLESMAEVRMSQQRGVPLIDHLNDITKELKAAYPAKFGLTPRPPSNVGNAAGGAGKSPTKKSDGRSYADLPAEAKAVCDRMIKEQKATGVKDPMTREKYCQYYDFGAK